MDDLTTDDITGTVLNAALDMLDGYVDEMVFDCDHEHADVLRNAGWLLLEMAGQVLAPSELCCDLDHGQPS